VSMHGVKMDEPPLLESLPPSEKAP